MKDQIKTGFIFFSIAVFAIAMQGCKKDMYVMPDTEYEQYYASIYVSSNPAGLTIYLNGRTMGTVTPDTIKCLPEGDYRVTLKNKYFGDTTLYVTAVNNKVTTGFVDYYQNTKMLGIISCTSEPAGAKIFIDNSYSGRVTPASIAGIIPKLHMVRLEYPDYRKDSAQVAVYSNSVVQCNLKLEDTLDVVVYNKSNSNLPSNDITCMAEDKQGNMWFGTSSEGLVKFDGKAFHRYSAGNISAISSNYVRRMICDKAGNLWFGLSNGITRFDGNYWTAIQTNMITSLKASRDNIITAATSKGGLVMYNNGNITKISSSADGLSSNDLISACIDNSGLLWAGVYTGGIDTYNNSVWKRLNSSNDGLPYNYNAALECDADGIVYGIFRSSVEASPATHAMARYENGSWTTIITSSAPLLYNNIFIDSKNIAWFGLGNTIYRMSDKDNAVSLASFVNDNLRIFSDKSQIVKFTSGKEAFVDSKGNIWIIGSPYDKGIIKIKADRWHY